MLKNVQISLNDFAKFVVKQSRTNLTKNKKNVSKELYNSIGYDLKVHPNSFSLRMMDDSDYWQYVDKGVSGTERKFNTPYSYKKSSNMLGFELATGTFANWAKARGLRFRSAKGTFAPGDYRSIGIAYALAHKKRGSKPTNFFSRPFELAYKKLPEEIIEAFGLDMEDLLKHTTE